MGKLELTDQSRDLSQSEAALLEERNKCKRGLGCLCKLVGSQFHCRCRSQSGLPCPTRIDPIAVKDYSRKSCVLPRVTFSVSVVRMLGAVSMAVFQKTFKKPCALTRSPSKICMVDLRSTTLCSGNIHEMKKKLGKSFSAPTSKPWWKT